MGDVLYIVSIFTVFVALGTLLPFINSEFGEDSETDYQFDEIGDGLTTDSVEGDSDSVLNLIGIGSSTEKVGILDILWSIAKVLTFTAGDIPFLLDLLLMIPRVILGLLIYRQIRSGSG